MKAVNLIPNETRAATKPAAAGAPAPAQRSSAVGAYAIIGALVFAIGASALYVNTTNDIAKNKADLAAVTQQANTVSAAAATMQSFADFKQLSDARVQTVEGLASVRFPWSRTLDDMSRALPSDVFINSFDGATSSAGGGSALRGAIAAPSIELSGCTRSQDSVARLMSALRGVRGVTRVSLSKSDEALDTASASAPAPATAADGTTSATTTAPCPKGQPPAFDLVVFFERAKVSPAAATNAAAGPTGSAGGPTGSTSTTSSSGPTGATAPAATTTP